MDIRTNDYHADHRATGLLVQTERLEWYRSPRVPRDKPLPWEVLLTNTSENYNEYVEALPAAKYRDLLVQRYGKAGEKILFAEAFETSEYGLKINETMKKILFPF